MKEQALMHVQDQGKTLYQYKFPPKLIETENSKFNVKV